MKAAVYRRFGPAREVLDIVDRDAPSPRAGEVLVRVRASGVNPSDVKLRAGKRPGGVAAAMPYPEITPHSDGAGVIEAVGEGVEPSRVGERVWLYNCQWERAAGSAQELVALPSAQAVALPEAASFAEGAALGIPAVTGWASVFAGGPVEGLRVLVTGGAGTVGAHAVRMAKLGGAAQVIATVSSPEKAAVAAAAGADVVIDYRREDVAERVLAATRGAGVDRISEVEFGGNLAASAAVIAPGGWIAAYASMAAPEPSLPFYPLMFKNVTLKMLVVYRLEATLRAGAEAAFAGWLARGALDIRIDSRFSLAEIALAHERVEIGERAGAVIVEI